jgi:hypothetical protein
METAEFSFSILRTSSTVSEMRHREKLDGRICNLLENKNLAHSDHVKKHKQERTFRLVA